MGHSHWGAVLLMYGWTAVVSVGLVVMALSSWPYMGWVVALALLTVLALTIRPVRSAPVEARSDPDVTADERRG